MLYACPKIVLTINHFILSFFAYLFSIFFSIGPHFRCPEDKHPFVCIFYLLDAYKAKKFFEIPPKVRYAVGTTIDAFKSMKKLIFPAHFVVQDVVDALKELGERLGIEFKQRSILLA